MFINIKDREGPQIVASKAISTRPNPEGMWHSRLGMEVDKSTQPRRCPFT